MSLRRSGTVPRGRPPAGMACVGSSVAVSATHRRRAAVHPAGRALRARRGAAARLARATGRRAPAAARGEWLWLVGVARDAGWCSSTSRWCAGPSTPSPRSSGSPWRRCRWCWPLAGPLSAGTRPSAAVVARRRVVAAGAALVRGRRPHRPRRAGLGGGRAAVEVGVHAARGAGAGPARAVGVRLHSVWIAAVAAGGARGRVEGPGGGRHAWTPATCSRRPPRRRRHRAGVRALVQRRSRLGAGRAGLFTGVVPVAAAAGGVLLGGPLPAPVVWAGWGWSPPAWRSAWPREPSDRPGAPRAPASRHLCQADMHVPTATSRFEEVENADSRENVPTRGDERADSRVITESARFEDRPGRTGIIGGSP